MPDRDKVLQVVREWVMKEENDPLWTSIVGDNNRAPSSQRNDHRYYNSNHIFIIN